MTSSNGRRSRRIADVPVPRDVGPPLALGRKAKVVPPEDPDLRREVAAVVRAANVDAVLASLSAKRRKLAPLPPPGSAGAKLRWAFDDVSAALTADGWAGQYPVVRITSDSFRVQPLTAAADGSGSPSQPRRRRRRTGTTGRSSRPGASAQGK